MNHTHKDNCAVPVLMPAHLASCSLQLLNFRLGQVLAVSPVAVVPANFPGFRCWRDCRGAV